MKVTKTIVNTLKFEYETVIVDIKFPLLHYHAINDDTTIRMTNSPTDIRNGYLTNTSQKCTCFANLLSEE